jgi:glycosidase
VIYQIYPRSFLTPTATASATSAGSRGRHVAGLGVDAIWLSPIYPSPMADFGYDVSDHTDVDPVFGDLAASTGWSPRRTGWA